MQKFGSATPAGKDVPGIIPGSMYSQRQLIDVLGRFTPKIVRMDG